jgi:hypothetical protein
MTQRFFQIVILFGRHFLAALLLYEAAFRHQARITSIGGFPERLLSLAPSAAQRLGILLFRHAINLPAHHFFSVTIFA